MTWSTWTYKELALVAAILMLACIAAVLSISLTRPRPFASTVLTQQWQCTRTAGILTVCTKKHG